MKAHIYPDLRRLLGLLIPVDDREPFLPVHGGIYLAGCCDSCWAGGSSEVSFKRATDGILRRLLMKWFAPRTDNGQAMEQTEEHGDRRGCCAVLKQPGGVIAPRSSASTPVSFMIRTRDGGSFGEENSQNQKGDLKCRGRRG